jgi:hypothetical protein
MSEEKLAGVAGLTWRNEADGTVSIPDVPVFQLGMHRGFDYGIAWADRAIRTFNADAGEGRRPSVIVGHNLDVGEKPAVGFMGNLRRIGNTLYADLVNIQREVFEQIRKGMWPQRSVEVYARSARIAALALLGGSSPYHRFPALAFKDEDGEIIHWAAGHGEPTVTFGDSMVAGGNRAKALSDDGREDMGDSSTMTTEDLNRELESLRAQKAGHDVELFQRDMRELGFSPAFIDSPEIAGWVDHAVQSGERVMFAEEEIAGLGVPERVLRLVADLADKKTLFTQSGEVAVMSGSPDDDDESDRFSEGFDPVSVEMRERAETLSREKGMTFREAFLSLRMGE